MTPALPANNPLCDFHDLPDYAAVKPEHIEPALDALIAAAEQTLEQITAPDTPATWNAVIAPLERATEHLGRAWGVVGHLNAVADTPALRAAYNAMLPRVTEFWTRLGQNEGLLRQYQTLHDAADFAALSPIRQRIISHALRDFRLSGALLEGQARTRYAEIQERLAALSQTFSEHVLDATAAHADYAEEHEIAGIPPDALQAAREAAQRDGRAGYKFTLHYPSYMPVLQHGEHRPLRERLYRAYVTRASELGDAQFDNSQVMSDILALRDEEAHLLGYAHYADVSLAPKMADTPQQVMHFLRDLAARARPFALRDLDTLRAFARTQLGMEQLEAWDLSWASEKLRQSHYTLSEQEVRQYFTLPTVITGLFRVIETLFGVHLRKVDGDIRAWHPDAELYCIDNAGGQTIGQFYLDLYARDGKRSGAWMDHVRSRWLRPDGTLQTPVATLTCNFPSPVGGKPALLSHDDVQTLFHEFGHGLHHMLTQVDDIAVSGISGVEWDAVELPSQLMENFCWEWDVLRFLTKHVDTGQPMPRALFDKMLAAKNFQSGMQTLRQVEFSLLDMRLHHDLKTFTAADIETLVEQNRQEIAVLQSPPFNRFVCSFSHIFAGGYAAGYYSYKWAEVLSADAYERFEEEGPLSPAVGQSYQQAILAVGGSRDALDSFKAFRGREPRIDALLRHGGMTAQAA
ncbi:MAG: M3 family metallopeptidase [Burkholderiaceae bacterium]|nr:M3 family metallopeptidase [Burkholderiaceae bacterium]